MEKIILKNNVSLIYKKAENTPRIALTCFVKIGEAEKIPGIYSVLNRLFTQGTKKRTAEQIAEEVERNALDIYSEMKSDYWKFSLVCLNEDFETAVELLSDMMLNSTLENFDKEIIKMKGETLASLDSPAVFARDKFVENLYKNHQYGNTGTVILENIDKITKEDVNAAYKDIFENAEKIFSLVGDISKEDGVKILEKYFAELKSEKNEKHLSKPNIEPQSVKIPKEDVNQAQVYQGWHMPSFNSEDSAPLTVLNTILGASGLSSRLFLELRDKKGLAYTVRSIYNKFGQIGDFRVYIATEPKNIKVSLDGFKIETDRLKNELVSQKELDSAVNNIIGKIEFVSETNIQKASMAGVYELYDLGYDYLEKWIEMLKKVTPEDVMRAANKYFNNAYVTAILAPSEFLKDL